MADTSLNTYYEATIEGEDGTDLGTLKFTAPTILHALTHLGRVLPELEAELGEEPHVVHLARVAPPEPDPIPEPDTEEQETATDDSPSLNAPEPAAGF